MSRKTRIKSAFLAVLTLGLALMLAGCQSPEENGQGSSAGGTVSQQEESVSAGPRTEETTEEDGSKWLYEYDGEGNLLRSTHTQYGEGYTFTQVFNENGGLVRELTEYDDPAESAGRVSNLFEYSPEWPRLAHEKAVSENPALWEVDYTYENNRVSVRIQYDNPAMEPASCDTTVVYTLLNPDASLYCTGYEISDGRMDTFYFVEKYAQGKELCRAKLNPDGSIEAVLTE